MAWRIDENVVRGEVDNRVKGTVTGRVWIAGAAEPLVLKLKGNAHSDLAGCFLRFTNKQPAVPLRKDATIFNPQDGVIGDLTASRKVKVYEVSLTEATEMIERGEKPPEHMANCLYLEWFSARNGRMVIESADYALEISAPEWRMTPEEEANRSREAAANFSGYMEEFNRLLRAAEHRPPEDKEWDEFDYEKFMKESDARTDKYMELLDKYGDDDAAEEKIAKEMGWTRPGEIEDAEEDESWEMEELSQMTHETEENLLKPDPSTEGVDWIRTSDGDLRHPLQNRCFLAAIALWDKLDAMDLPQDADRDLAQFAGEFRMTSTKLAGALNSLMYGRDITDGAFTVAYLKRALDHLHKAQAGLEKTAAKKLLPEEVIRENRQELFAIREEILRLMEEFRNL
ncbi:MAG: hypothetical protein K0Q55_430 [Verrucomicrobia bacterium]|jgi:hypothetical protein|nr:hypothetical protein [Verrucomicrobiota bacterium]